MVPSRERDPHADVRRYRAHRLCNTGYCEGAPLTLVYLARHGETESNLLRRYAGSRPEPITRAGRAQMMTLRTRLEVCGIAAIWTSEVARARESAALLSEALRVPVRHDTRLNEMRLGPWEGLTEAQVAETYPGEYALWCTAPEQVAQEGRETLTAVSQRVESAVEDAARQDRPVVLMTHVAPIRVAVLTTLGVPLRHYRSLVVRNGDCVVLDHDRGEASRFGAEHSLRAEFPVSPARRPVR